QTKRILPRRDTPLGNGRHHQKHDMGSEIWWTGATHIISQLGPTYHNIARCIKGLPKWTWIPPLLREAGLPSLEFRLDRNSRKYGIMIILAEDDHPGKEALLQFMSKQEHGSNKTGLRRIARLLKDIFKNSRMKETTNHHCEYLRQPQIATPSKEWEGEHHRTWAKTLPSGTIVLYMDGSKADDGTTWSTWHYIQTEGI
ncbi:hypothetical protein Q9L58_010392, partial [Maublancomyces gigas]